MGFGGHDGAIILDFGLLGMVSVRLGLGLDVKGGVTFTLAEGTGHVQQREQHEQKTEMGSHVE